MAAVLLVADDTSQEMMAASDCSNSAHKPRIQTPLGQRVNTEQQRVPPIDATSITCALTIAFPATTSVRIPYSNTQMTQDSDSDEDKT